jgi:NAD(P)-dependent dehydrogenase (short-subunit alcohol dehydrogenase family)
MESVVHISAQERARGGLNPAAAQAAAQALATQGYVVLRGVFAPEAVDALYREWVARYGTIDLAAMDAESRREPPNPITRRGPARFETVVSMTGAFGRPELLANSLLMNFLAPLLGGEDMRLGSVTVVASYPGAGAQQPHRDCVQLFSEFAELGGRLPMHAVNVSVPLIDIGIDTGPTELWPGTHRLPANIPAPANVGRLSFPFQRGDCVLIDFRTFHAGLPNRSTQVRPILYLQYSRSWFLDEVNHQERLPLDMPLEAYRELPPPVRNLLLRVYSQAMRTQMASATGSKRA